MIDVQLLKELYKHFDTLKNTSIDDHDNNIAADYMTESNFPVVNFDRVKTDYVMNLHIPEVPKSCDALLMKDESTWFLIEFKNGSIDNNKNYAIRGKIYVSLLILLDIIQRGISFSRQHIHYILVYNEDKIHTSKSFNPSEFEKIRYSESLATIGKSISKLAKETYVQFGLSAFERLYFKSVNTYTKKQFEKEFVSKL